LARKAAAQKDAFKVAYQAVSEELIKAQVEEAGLKALKQLIVASTINAFFPTFWLMFLPFDQDQRRALVSKVNSGI